MATADVAKPALVLWDIDRTLLYARDVSHQIYEVAFERVVGRRLERFADMAGRTEHAIVADTLALHGVTAPDLDGFFAAMVEAAEELEDRLRTTGHALPGAVEAVAALSREGVVQSVVTGNLPAIARLKLEAFGLAAGLDLEVGGYGSDHGVRSTLVRLAIERAGAKYGARFEPSRVVVIGDTRHDVEAAHVVGAWAVGVATGGTTAADLADHGADAVLADLSDPARLTHLVFGRFLKIDRD